MKYDEICNLGDKIEEGGVPVGSYWHLQRDVKYAPLVKVLIDAYRQASSGKGAQRHCAGNEDFESQPIMSISRQVGDGFCLGQAVKKIFESRRLGKAVAIQELLGAIVYVSAAVLLREEEK